MKFYASRDLRWIVNYPKLHYSNGCDKNSQEKTNGWFKPTVRIFKNARNKLIDDGKVVNNIAPSYFLECLLYNVPNSKYGANWQTTFSSILNWLKDADFDNLKTQSEQELLFGSTPEQWNITNAKKLVEKILEL